MHWKVCPGCPGASSPTSRIKLCRCPSRAPWVFLPAPAVVIGGDSPRLMPNPTRRTTAGSRSSNAGPDRNSHLLSTWATITRDVAGWPSPRECRRCRREVGLLGPGRAFRSRRGEPITLRTDAKRPLAMAGNWPKLIPSWGPTRLRRGFGFDAGHAEHQFARKTTGNKVTANDTLRSHSPLKTGELRNSWPMGWA